MKRTRFGLFLLCSAIGLVLAACGGGSDTGGLGATGAAGSSYHRSATGVEGPTGATGATGPVVLSLSELKTQASKLGEPMYWAGPAKEQGATYEYTLRRDKVYIRYLPAGVKANEEPAQLLIVGTYPIVHAYEALHRVAKGTGETGPDGSFIWARQGDAKSAYIAWPDVPYEVEVYDPKPGRALTIAKSGDVQPVS